MKKISGDVRIIHGKGIGVQREQVRSILARTSVVLNWTDAPQAAFSDHLLQIPRKFLPAKVG